MKKNKQNKPPVLAEYLLKKVFPDSGKYTSLGDFEEEYNQVLAENGRLNAYFWYWRQVFKSFPGYSKNKIFWGTVMLRNYVKTALRNYMRNKAYTFINVFGLAAGLASTLLILLWVQNEISYDRFFKNDENIYRVISKDVGGPVVYDFPHTPAKLSQTIKDEIPEIINSARFTKDSRSPFKYNDKVFYEDKIVSADPSFFEIFSYRFIKGDPKTALTDKYSMVITEKIAKKYFGDEDPIGKVLKWNNWTNYTITGIIKDIPSNSHITFDFIRNYELEKTGWPQGFSWYNFNRHTYVQLNENADVEEVNRKITEVLYKNNQYMHKGNRILYLQPLGEIHLDAGLQGEYADVLDINYVYIYSFIAFFILTIACINFINLSTARSIKRSCEVGIRKVVGASRTLLIRQFLGESFLLSFAGLFAAVIAVFFLLPHFNYLTGKNLSLNIFDLKFITGALIILFLTGILAGSYPAVYLSSFRPAAVLQNIFGRKKKSAFLRKFLVTGQFTISILLIICTVIVFRQLQFMRNADLGFEKENIIYIPAKDNIGKNYMAFKGELLSNPNILAVSCQNCPPTVSVNHSDIFWEGAARDMDFDIEMIMIDHDYFKTMGMEMAEGRSYSVEFPTDVSDAVIINREAAVRMGPGSPLGKRVRIWGKNRTIIGIMKNAHFKSLREKINPQAFQILTEGEYLSNGFNLLGFVLIRIKGDSRAIIENAVSSVRRTWKKINPNYPFEFHFLDETIDRLYENYKKVSSIISYFAILAIIISCLGLFGLASFTAENRIKEIGIRKVFGASVKNIIGLVTWEFIMLVIIANIIAWPLSWYFMNKWLSDFAYRINIGIWAFIYTGVLAVIIALVTVGYQSIKAARANPVDSIKYE